MRRYICARCAGEVEAQDKYELSRKWGYIDFGVPMEDFADGEENVVAECGACYERRLKAAYEPAGH